MKIVIDCTPKEIAALVVALQERQEEFVPEDSTGKRYDGFKQKQICLNTPTVP